MMIEYTEGYHNYYIYILSNKYRTTLYIGVTNNLKRRLQEHQDNIIQKTNTFVSRYNLCDLLYYEHFTWVKEAIAREKELKKWRRSKKNELIRKMNPTFDPLNSFFI